MRKGAVTLFCLWAAGALLALDGNLDEARQHLAARRFDKAERSVNEFLRENADHPEALMLKARILMEDQRSMVAKPILLSLQEKYPNWGQPVLLLAQVAMDENQPEQAMEFARQAGPLLQQKELGWLVIGQAHERLQNDAEAFIAYKNALEINPDLLMPRTYLVRRALRQGFSRLAGEHGAELLGRHPDQLGNWPGLVMPLLEVEAFDMARKELDALRAKRPGEPAKPWMEYARGVLAMHDKKYPEAEALLRSAVKGNPDLVEARQVLGAVLLAEGQVAQARSELEAVLAKRPRMGKARLLLAGLELKVDNVERALELCRSAPENDSHAADLLELEISVLARMGLEAEAADARRRLEELRRYAAVVEEAKAALAENPRDTAAHLVLARAAILEGRRAAAVARLQTLLGLDPAHVEGNYWMGLTLLALGKPLEAEPFLKKIAAEFAEDADVQRGLKEAEKARAAGAGKEKANP